MNTRKYLFASLVALQAVLICGQAHAEPVGHLPDYVAAQAYAEAAQAYCPDGNLINNTLISRRITQRLADLAAAGAVGPYDLFHARRAANDHLKNYPSACKEAVKFVEDVIVWSATPWIRAARSVRQN